MFKILWMSLFLLMVSLLAVVLNNRSEVKGRIRVLVQPDAETDVMAASGTLLSSFL